jgi:hypothetical protein
LCVPTYIFGRRGRFRALSAPCCGYETGPLSTLNFGTSPPAGGALAWLFVHTGTFGFNFDLMMTRGRQSLSISFPPVSVHKLIITIYGAQCAYGQSFRAARPISDAMGWMPLAGFAFSISHPVTRTHHSTILMSTSCALRPVRLVNVGIGTLISLLATQPRQAYKAWRCYKLASYSA